MRYFRVILTKIIQLVNDFVNLVELKGIFFKSGFVYSKAWFIQLPAIQGLGSKVDENIYI